MRTHVSFFAACLTFLTLQISRQAFADPPQAAVIKFPAAVSELCLSQDGKTAYVWSSPQFPNPRLFKVGLRQQAIQATGTLPISSPPTRVQVQADEDAVYVADLSIGVITLLNADDLSKRNRLSASGLERFQISSDKKLTVFYQDSYQRYALPDLKPISERRPFYRLSPEVATSTPKAWSVFYETPTMSGRVRDGVLYDSSNTPQLLLFPFCEEAGTSDPRTDAIRWGYRDAHANELPRDFKKRSQSRNSKVMERPIQNHVSLHHPAAVLLQYDSERMPQVSMDIFSLTGERVHTASFFPLQDQWQEKARKECRFGVSQDFGVALWQRSLHVHAIPKEVWRACREPLRFQPQQTHFVLHPTEPTELRFEASGGRPPYTFEARLVYQVKNFSRAYQVDKTTGKVTIDGPEIIKSLGIHGKDFDATNNEQIREVFLNAVGRNPTGKIYPIFLELTVRDADDEWATLKPFIFADVPVDAPNQTKQLARVAEDSRQANPSSRPQPQEESNVARGLKKATVRILSVVVLAVLSGLFAVAGHIFRSRRRR